MDDELRAVMSIGRYANIQRLSRVTCLRPRAHCSICVNCIRRRNEDWEGIEAGFASSISFPGRGVIRVPNFLYPSPNLPSVHACVV